MRLRTIAFTNLRRRKARAAFLVAGLLIGVGTVVALLVAHRVDDRQGAAPTCESFGANIVVTPRSKDVALSYGGIDRGRRVGGRARRCAKRTLARIESIPARRQPRVVAPELVGAVRANGRRVLLMGVRPCATQFKLKRWWSVDAGRPPANGHELVAGAAAAERPAPADGRLRAHRRPTLHRHRPPARDRRPGRRPARRRPAAPCSASCGKPGRAHARRGRGLVRAARPCDEVVRAALGRAARREGHRHAGGGQEPPARRRPVPRASATRSSASSSPSRRSSCSSR